ncbi:MAG TPA: class I SAM-dependent methyltransferase [Candidatus Baltobacteraceae bacterium]|jgi:SAM-dependent methyltransferase|nr:class I SAM-dependent methyltransferase [Candidatus Baltobacteraceae bacterium]
MLEESFPEVERLTRKLLASAAADFGLDDAAVERLLPRLASREGQARLFAEIENTIGAGYFSARRSIMEAGCGTGSFVVPALERGHDAYGVDNDPERLDVAYARIDEYGLPPEWKARMPLGDATHTPFAPNTFDVVLGHQFIEHVPDPAGAISEMLRVTKPGGFVVLYAPDYRAPFEAHYEIPWPPFAARWMLETWLDAFERPHGGLNSIFPVTLLQLAGIFQALDCDLVRAQNDFEIEPHVGRHFAMHDEASIRATAAHMRAGHAAATLPRNFMMPTSLAIAARKR